MAARYSLRGNEYELTPVDLVWAGRMVVGEGGRRVSRSQASAYLWAMMNRFLIMGKWSDYSELLRAFSQPINPKWKADGAKCKPGSAWHGTKFCAASRLARREKITAMRWDDLPAVVRDAVSDFAEGVLPRPEAWRGAARRTITNWGASWLKKMSDGRLVSLSEKYPWGVELGGEWFFSDTWVDEQNVKVVRGAAPSDERRGGGVLIGAMCVVAVVMIWAVR